MNHHIFLLINDSKLFEAVILLGIAYSSQLLIALIYENDFKLCLVADISAFNSGWKYFLMGLARVIVSLELTVIFMPEPEDSRHQGEYILVVVVVVLFISHLLKSLNFVS